MNISGGYDEVSHLVSARVHKFLSYLYLCNLATGRTVTQSSTFDTWVGEQAIDLNPSFIQPSSSCSSTDIQTNPWWRVDLHYIYRVSSVVITNRLDCCPERINGAEIRIGNSLENNGNNNPICAVISSIPAGVSSTYICNDMDGRYVNLFLPGDSRFLTLCEVEVYGEARWGTAAQSKLFYDWYTQNALDGLSSTCSHTTQTDQWWKLDLMKMYSVNRVTITNRLDCCESRINGAEIHVGNFSSDVFSNPVCAVVPSIPAGATYSYSCCGMQGRYVTVNSPRNSRILTLCEVGVYLLGGSVNKYG
uniref:Fucolectin tachylectin-4 pentraxin-1 domain-containing protein n=1 Tax=Cyprinus carpio TaxID=7962 RepID=A0A8C2C0E7_CYPCA